MKQIGEIIKVIFDEKMMEKADGYSAVFSCWKDLTDKNGIPSAAAHSWIKSLDNGIVWIEVDHPGWKQILQTKERKLLHDFRYRFPEMGISAISIMLYRPGNKPETLWQESVAEAPVAYDAGEYLRNGDSSDQTEMEDNDESNPEYDNIKNQTLKKLLMRLEKSIGNGK